MYRTALVVLMIALTSVGGWWMYDQQQHRRDLVELERARAALSTARADLEGARRELERSEAARREAERRAQELAVRLALLKVDHRVARIEVVSQEPDPADPGRTRTRIRFLEYDREGHRVGPEQEIELEGKRVYLETLVIKFDDEHVESGEFLRGTSLCLFQRVFSERVAPEDGVPIDRPGSHPVPYTDGDAGDDLFLADLWARFWEYASDPEAAAAVGVRAIHGEAPFVELRPGRSYRVELRSSGGLSIRPE
jgi:hypothetical protein